MSDEKCPSCGSPKKEEPYIYFLAIGKSGYMPPNWNVAGECADEWHDTVPAASEGGTGTRPRTSAQCWECDTPDKCMSAELCYAGNAGFPKPLASVEGQRTGAAECPECHAKSDVEAQQKCAPGEDNCPMTCWEHWPLQAEFDAREAEQIKLADKQIAESSVPGVEGMGAREIAQALWLIFPRQHREHFEYKSWLTEATDKIEAYARSLRGAGGEREPDATTIAKAIAYWRDRALAAEDENLRLKLLSDHVECYWDLEDPDCSIESPETYASENGLKVGDEFTLQAAQYWPVQFVVKKTFTDEETDDDWEVEEVGKKRADFPDYITIKARAEASESREQEQAELIVGMKSQLMQALKNHQEATFRIGEAESREQAMRENLKVSHNVLRTELGRKCDIQREDGLCEICRKN